MSAIVLSQREWSLAPPVTGGHFDPLRAPLEGAHSYWGSAALTPLLPPRSLEWYRTHIEDVQLSGQTATPVLVPPAWLREPSTVAESFSGEQFSVPETVLAESLLADNLFNQYSLKATSREPSCFTNAMLAEGPLLTVAPPMIAHLAAGNLTSQPAPGQHPPFASLRTVYFQTCQADGHVSVGIVASALYDGRQANASVSEAHKAGLVGAQNHVNFGGRAKITHKILVCCHTRPAMT